MQAFAAKPALAVPAARGAWGQLAAVGEASPLHAPACKAISPEGVQHLLHGGRWRYLDVRCGGPPARDGSSFKGVLG